REKYRDTGRKKYELPKNIRQVGNAPGNYKIYLEDYVMTYLRKLAAPGNMRCRGAILPGRIYRQDGEKVMFI
ncbi:peptidoglycan-binding protein, partial [Coprococcus eutactus]|nr:peptidoglycan-binding protein [Coprococcus eutactus]